MAFDGKYAIFGAFLGGILTYFFGIGAILGLTAIIPIALLEGARKSFAKASMNSSFEKVSQLSYMIGILENLYNDLAIKLKEINGKGSISLRDIKDKYKKYFKVIGINIPDSGTSKVIEELMDEIKKVENRLNREKEIYSTLHEKSLNQYMSEQ